MHAQPAWPQTSDPMPASLLPMTRATYQPPHVATFAAAENPSDPRAGTAPSGTQRTPARPPRRKPVDAREAVFWRDDLRPGPCVPRAGCTGRKATSTPSRDAALGLGLAVRPRAPRGRAGKPALPSHAALAKPRFESGNTARPGAPRLGYIRAAAWLVADPQPHDQVVQVLAGGDLDAAAHAALFDEAQRAVQGDGPRVRRAHAELDASHPRVVAGPV